MNTEKYNSILNKFFKSPNEAISEIINLQAILNLPKGTEHFLSDLHGEADTFIHILKNASGVIRLKLEAIFKNYMTSSEIQDLLTLIYYPEERILLTKKTEKDMAGWCKKTLLNLIKVLREISSKYTRSKVRKALPADYAYIMDELINMTVDTNKESYYENILNSIIELGEGTNFIIALCQVIQRLAIDHLHIVGDIYDRGKGPDIILDRLMNYHSLDIQWGNHDILWVGAFLGNLACIANVIRINCRYNNLSILESAYGINLRALETYALKLYENDPCQNFKIKDLNNNTNPFDDMSLLSKMHKAITILQFKLENKIIAHHPEWNMNERIILKEELTKEDISLLNILKQEFMQSKRLKEHITFLMQKGSMYLVYNNNLLMHGCVPTNKDGTFTKLKIGEDFYSGKALYDKCNEIVLNAFNNKDKYSIDFMWYLWCGKNSPLFGRDVMRTYETYMLNKKIKENKNPYYNYVKNEDFCDKVLKEFGIDNLEYAHIINGHTPVKVIDGEKPISGNGKHIVIDGGLSRAYHKHTGIGGYTLMSNSHGLYLTTHAPFCKIKEAIERKIDLHSDTTEIQRYKTRIKVKDTDNGKLLQDQIDVLKLYLKSYYKMHID